MNIILLCIIFLPFFIPLLLGKEVMHFAEVNVAKISQDLYSLKSLESKKVVFGSWSACHHNISRINNPWNLKFRLEFCHRHAYMLLEKNKRQMGWGTTVKTSFLDFLKNATNDFIFLITFIIFCSFQYQQYGFCHMLLL